ncbi:MAG TPA: LacI family DNA-binding transcriptional regulator [Bacteroidia bacterium]|nr:LacI family DNA-binding transcriptional regulator [Bacteroidia bacterium]
MGIKKTLLEDIAKELNVSKTLVSMVINGKGDAYGISKKTQEKVLAKAGEMEYTPNVFARALRTGKSHLIALLVADISNPFYSNIAKHVEKELATKGYNLMICSTDENVEREEKLISLFAEQHMIDGLIIATTNTSGEYFKKERLRNFPIVFIDRYLPDIESNYVVANNYQGSYELTELLVKKGCKNILALNITPSHISSLTERVKGYKDALKKHDIAFKDENLVEISFDNIQNDVRTQLTKRLKQGKIDAIYTLNNHIATACLNVFNEMGFDAKKEGVLFASFDDISLFDFVKPSVISVSQPVENIGIEAANLALHLIDSKTNTTDVKKIVLPTSIISRN